MIEFSEIESGLLVGTCPRDEQDVRQLSDAGASAVICLQSDDDLRRHQIDWQSLEASYRASGITPQRIAMIDFDEENIAGLLPLAVDAVNRAMDAGHVVYLHCSAGRERSPTVAAAWLVHCRGLSVDDAARQIKRARSSNPYIAMLESMVRQG